MGREWKREQPARWDEDKAQAFGNLPPSLFGLGSPSVGDALGDEWWRVEDDGQAVGYGRLDDVWGDAEILVVVSEGGRGRGLGGFIMGRLEQEAGKRHLNYLYNVVPTGHPKRDEVTAWLESQGFTHNEVGELRKRIPTEPHVTSV